MNQTWLEAVAGFLTGFLPYPISLAFLTLLKALSPDNYNWVWPFAEKMIVFTLRFPETTALSWAFAIVLGLILVKYCVYAPTALAKGMAFGIYLLFPAFFFTIGAAMS